MRNLNFFDANYEYIQISKARAKKLYNEGQKIGLCTSKFRPVGHWSNCAIISNKNNETFENRINSYSYYNCTNETGKYITFYKIIERA